MALSQALTDRIQAIDATFKRIEQTLDEGRQDHERFLLEMAHAQKRYDAIKRGGAK